jgi:hypothetical protein
MMIYKKNDYKNEFDPVVNIRKMADGYFLEETDNTLFGCYTKYLKVSNAKDSQEAFHAFNAGFEVGKTQNNKSVTSKETQFFNELSNILFKNPNTWETMGMDKFFSLVKQYSSKGMISSNADFLESVKNNKGG